MPLPILPPGGADIRSVVERINVLIRNHNSGNFEELAADVAALEADVTTLQGDVTALQGDVSTLQTDVSGLQSDVSALQSDMTALEGYNHELQFVYTQTGAVATGTTTIPIDDSIPQQTEGDQYMSLAITPLSASSVLVIDVVIHLQNSAASTVALIAALFRDSTANALAASFTSAATQFAIPIKFRHVVASGSTSATTFKVRGGSNAAGTITFNGSGSARLLGGVTASSMTIREVVL